MTLQTLFTKRLTLEPQTVAHADRLFERFQDEELYPYITRVPPTSLQKFREGLGFLERRRNEPHEELWLNWVMVSKDSRDLVGQVEVSLNSKTLEFFLAYTTFKAHWRQGLAKEACAAVSAHMFADWKATKAIIEMDVRNAASMRLAESLGARRVAYAPRAQQLKGEWSDEYRYELNPQTMVMESLL